MAYTGFNFKENFDRRIDKSFSDYYNFDQERQFYKRIVQLAIDSKYEVLNKQKRFDELRSILGGNVTIPVNSTAKIFLQPIAIGNFNFTTGVITTAFPHNALVGSQITYSIQGNTTLFSGTAAATAVTSNTITIPLTSLTETFVSGQLTTEGTITDYMHLFSIRVGYNVPVNNIEIEGFEVSTSFVNIIFNKRVKYRDGSLINISGATGTTNINGLRYLKQIGQKKYQLFQDKDLIIPVVGNNTYTGGGSIVEPILSKQIFQLKPDQINYESEPSYSYPMFRIDTNSITVEPSDNISYVIFDYMTLPKIDIDPEDNEIDLLLYYPRAMLEYFIDFGASMFDLETRNGQGFNLDSNQIVINP
jgi:hypothetical protein